MLALWTSDHMFACFARKSEYYPAFLAFAETMGFDFFDSPDIKGNG